MRRILISIKERVALGSVIAAIILTSIKITVGLTTNSLGILSEALHSGIDLLAAAMTLFAVRVADRPPDLDHHYGHEKIESLSSLAEVALLFITCAWILFEALNRLFITHESAHFSIIALGVMIMSICIDFTRSRALMRVAKETKSQALEADAVHFSTDLISSVVVIFGILLTMIGFAFFDSLAAIGVAVVTAFIGYRLWKKCVHTLLDGAPEGISLVVASEAMKVDGVLKVGKIRVRESGPKTFIDATVFIDKALPLEQAHRVTYQLEKRVEEAVEGADIVVHAEPLCAESASLMDKIRAEASNFPEIRNIHNLTIIDDNNLRYIEFHIEVDGELKIADAHAIATELERVVIQLDSAISLVTSHIEPAECAACASENKEGSTLTLMALLEEIPTVFPEIRGCDKIAVHHMDDKLRVSMCCSFDRSLSVSAAHEVSTKVEGYVRIKYPDVDQVSVHMEPDCWFDQSRHRTEETCDALHNPQNCRNCQNRNRHRT